MTDQFIMAELALCAARIEANADDATTLLDQRETLIARARSAGHLWSEIAEALGISERRAQKIGETAQRQLAAQKMTDKLVAAKVVARPGRTQ